MFVYFGFDDLLHVGDHVIQLQSELTLFLLQLLFDPLQVVDLLPQVGHGVGVLLSQRAGRGFMLQGGLFEVPAHLLELGLSLFVHLYLGGRGSSGLLQPLADLLQLSGQVSPLFLHLGTGCSLGLQFLLQLLNASLGSIYWIIKEKSFPEYKNTNLFRRCMYLELFELLLELHTHGLFILYLAQ